MDHTGADFDFGERLHELRCHETGWLRSRRDELRREQQRLRVEELAVVRILDERRALDEMPDPTVSTRTARETLEVARSLESTPAIAKASYEGRISWDQLAPLARVATPQTDREWARRGPRWSPLDLEREARKVRAVTPEDADARREARELRIWREPDVGMVAGRFRLPDVDGILVEEVFEYMAECMRPAKGMAWDSLEHRKADALVELCTKYASVEPRRRRKPLVVIQMPVAAVTDDAVPGATVGGIPIANETARMVLADARVIHETRPLITTAVGGGGDRGPSP
jgi:hypothetical protein